MDFKELLSIQTNYARISNPIEIKAFSVDTYNLRYLQGLLQVQNGWQQLTYNFMLRRFDCRSFLFDKKEELNVLIST
jgi:hypothetical protein